MNTDDYIRRIEELESQNASLMKWQQSVNSLLTRVMDVLDEHGKRLDENEIERLTLQLQVISHQGMIDAMPFELADPDLSLPVLKPHIISEKETLRLLIHEKKSIARFGDGEFALMAGVSRWSFQSADLMLGQKLQEVLFSNNDNLLIAINPAFYESQLFKNDDDSIGIRSYMTPEVRKQHSALLDPNRVYANALVFRNLHSDEDFSTLRELWKGRECVVVEGQHTGFGVRNGLLADCKKVERIICPAVDAFSVYDRILDAVTKHSKNKLILIALGPTATALAYDLSKEGYQAVDIGQIDLVFEAHLLNLSSINDLHIPDKYCTEDVRGDERIIQDINDPEYLSQIIARIY